MARKSRFGCQAKLFKNGLPSARLSGSFFRPPAHLKSPFSGTKPPAAGCPPMEAAGPARRAPRRRGPGRKKQGRKPPPLTYFRESEGAFYLDLERLGRGGGADPAYLIELRCRLEPERLASNGIHDPEAISDEALASAAEGGIVGNPAFLDIVDDILVRAHCLHCYHTTDRRRAEEGDQQITNLLKYFSQEGYEGSNGFYRQLGALCRDATAAEAALIARHPRGGPYDNSPPPSEEEEAARVAAGAVSRAPGLAAIHAAHPPAGGGGLLAAAGLAFWLCSTPEARRFLRQLAREARRRGLALTTRAAAGGASPVAPRFRSRYYEIEFHGDAGLRAAWGGIAAVLRGGDKKGGE